MAVQHERNMHSNAPVNRSAADSGKTRQLSPARLPTDPTGAIQDRVKKRIIVCCDGTWQDGISESRRDYTNVLRLARTINHEDVRTKPPTPQIVFYQSGIGSEKNFYAEYIEGTTGGGLVDKVEEAYAFIAHNYLPGDEIFLFGFSRGAYTARMVATLIGAIGILGRKDMDHFARIFLSYQKLGKTKDQEEREALREALAPFSAQTCPGLVRAYADGKPFSVKCLGVFDTVGSLGLPEELTLQSNKIKTLFGFPDRILGEHIERAYHALALNEPRKNFDCTKLEQTDIGRSKGQILKECWFSGSHSDIGGGYRDHDLADLTLTWMVAHVSDILSMDLSYLALLPHPVAPWGAQEPHDPLTGIFSLSITTQRTLPTSENDVTHESIHPSVLEQPALDPAIQYLVDEHPELIAKLLPLEEEMKAQWPYDPEKVQTHDAKGDRVKDNNLVESILTSTFQRLVRLPVPVILCSCFAASEEAILGPKISASYHLLSLSLASTARLVHHSHSPGDAALIMGVQDLVELFESAGSSKNSPTHAQPKRKSSGTSTQIPSPSPARFISVRPPTLRNRKASYTGLPSEFDDIPTTLTTNTPSFHDDTTVDITDSVSPHNDGVLEDSRAHLDVGDGDGLTNPFEDDSDTQKLLDHKHTYPPHSNSECSSSSTLAHNRHIGPHKPIPVAELFSRSAPPLHLPKLDAYLETLPKLQFNYPRHSTDSPMFPPMDRLAASGYTLEELESNSRVASWWRDRKTLLGSAVNLVLGLTGSSVLATFYSLQGISNTVQVFALILSTLVPVKGDNLGDHWRKLFLGTVPNVLALNLASGLTESLIFLGVFMALASLLLYKFWRSARNSDRYTRIEGLQQTDPESKQWKLIIITFLLTLIYLPMSTMAVHVLVWSQDLWIVPNPYINATSLPPDLSALGPTNEYRDPLDFCWTTTMKRNEINYAPVVIVLSIITMFSLTIWFPIALRRVIQKSVPKVDRFTELGRPRNKIDMDTEYHRLLTRDNNPFAFLYAGFRRNWGTYESTYLFAKLSTLVVVAVIDPDNCLFRSAPRTVVPIVRQVLLLASTIGFFLAQCFLAPFLDPVNNASEWTSRLNYVLTSVLALLVALDIPGKDLLNNYILYLIYILTYGLSFYFTVINLSISKRLVKRLGRRIDFSIDVFSPRLALSFPSPHVKRRIWQESITALLLTSPECKIPPQQKMAFAEARDSEFPPYLLNFIGTPGERHVENLKASILREVGSLEYRKAVALTYGPDYERYRQLEDEIQQHYTGPDCYWKDPRQNSIKHCTHFFGNAWLIPFPPTLVVRYDDGRYAVLTELKDLELYVNQNSSRMIQRRREIRLSLRALEGQRVIWPYEHVEPVGTKSFCCGIGRRYSAKTSVHLQTAILKIERRGHLECQGVQLGSGFSVQLDYGKEVVLDGDAIGLSDDFELTSPLARFFHLNRDGISARLHGIESVFARYRQHHREECRQKADVLSYRFLTNVYDLPRDPQAVGTSSIRYERDLRVRQLMVGSEFVFETAYNRLLSVSQTEASTWWYIFWDDLWRRNADTISNLRLHATDFNPHYPSSIAYTPLPRPALESFLMQRGLLSKRTKWGDFFTSGFLNKLYLRLNDTVFRGSSRAIWFHMGDGDEEFDMDDVDVEMQGEPSHLGTGGGTDHDNASIRPRPTYRWEGLLDDPPQPIQRQRRKFMTKVGAWFGVSPTWRAGMPSHGVSVDVRLQDGRYVLLEECSSLIERK
uniref:T6SS Phospholipase effector Tle1-like catalytic domain-containing protein n=1 Tax=Moniliophthora roreri TaxID=221103 RepID=A0A0W0F5N8_MONRR